MKQLLRPVLMVWLLCAASACQPSFAEPHFSEPVPAAAEQHRRTLIRAAHQDLGLNAPIATLAGQVHQESRWRPDADSPAGAQGIAQFMPATADWMAELYPRSLGDAQPYNPGWALRAMVRYDKWLLERVQALNACDEWAMALSAYNGGLGWVYRDRKLALASGASGLVWFHSNNTDSDTGIAAPGIASLGIESFNAGRSAANFRENRHYPRVILLRWEPLYVAAGWGRGVCGERT